MTPLFTKLNLKDQKEIVVLNAPESFQGETGQIEQHVKIHADITSVPNFDFILAFVTKQKEVNELVPRISEKLAGDGIVWFCYPKATSKKYTCEFNRDTGWNILGKHGFEGVRQIAIDEDWTALRFRRVQYIKAMSRNFAMTKEGKDKTGKK